MDFIVGLPLTSRNHDSIWVVVDKLTKTAHFITVNSTYSAKDYAEIYLDCIVRLHGIPKTIIFDRGPQFIARFWEQLHENLGTKLIRSSATIPRRMDRQKDSTKSLKTCFGHVSFTLTRVGTNSWPWQNFLTIMALKLA
jgi:hypothetical protein